MTTERTPLVGGSSVPSYIIHTSRDRRFRQRVRKLQCAVCAIIISILVVALVVTVSYAVDEAGNENNATTLSNETDLVSTTVIPPNIVQLTTVPNALQDSVLPSALLGLSQIPDSGSPAIDTPRWPIKDKPLPEWNHPVNETEIASAISYGWQDLHKKDVFEEKVPSLSIDSPSYRHGLATSTSAEAIHKSRAGYIMEAATRVILRNRPNGRGEVGRSAMFTVDWLPEEVCNKRETPACKPSTYRTYDGSCNNLRHPLSWGVAMMPFRRMLPPDYADGVSAPRKASDGSSLPSARDVSTTVHRPFYRDDPNFSVMLAVWGQFLDHDITATAISKGKDGQFISCCNRFFQAGLVPHPECYTVPLEYPDPFFTKMNVTCMEFVRASPAPMCSFGPREQLNQASNFIDGSVVYGNNAGIVSRLRTFKGGLMKTLITSDGMHLLPISTDPSDGCNQEEQLARGRYCFETGDARANENTHLTTLHLLFIRQHNLLATQLAELNPHWDDERLFQESRKIIAAQMQHIHYNEFLPVVLGPKVMDTLKMRPRQSGYSDTYDPELDPSIANGFAAAAYRFGHTLLPRLFHAVGKDNTSDEFIEMHKMLFNPFQLYDKGFIEKAVRGSIETPIKSADGTFSQEFTQHLFERDSNKSTIKKSSPPGLDLVALNVQRGRDHGLPAYPEFRTHCGLSRPTSFDQLEKDMDNGSVARMKEIYKSVDDIDFYTGAVSERPVEGSLVGPTVTCVLTDQFLRLQRGDRYWYETPEEPQAFTPEQLNSLRRTTLAKILCDTSFVEGAQKRVMQSRGPKNQKENCSDLPGLDLTHWKENPQDLTSRVKKSPSDFMKTFIVGEPMLSENLDVKENDSKSYKESLRLVGGEVNIDGRNVWRNGLPLAFPANLLENEQSSLLWNGTVRIENTQFIYITGRFSFPTPSNQVEGGTAWVNGEFKFHFQTNVTLQLIGPYNTTVHLAKIPNINEIPEETLTRMNPKDGSQAAMSQFQGNDLSNAILNLYGTYSLDEKEFLWLGDCALVLPGQTIQQGNKTNKYEENDRVFDAFVNGGSINIEGENIWVGNRVPLSLPFGHLKSLAATSRRVPWNGSIQSVNPRTLKLWGGFSLPLLDANQSTVWYNGDIAIQLKLYEDIELNLNGSYSSFFYLRETNMSTADVQNAWSLAAESVIPSDDPTQLLQDAVPFPVILHGTHSPDGNFFICSGNITMVIVQ